MYHIISQVVGRTAWLNVEPSVIVRLCAGCAAAVGGGKLPGVAEPRQGRPAGAGGGVRQPRPAPAHPPPAGTRPFPRAGRPQRSGTAHAHHT